MSDPVPSPSDIRLLTRRLELMEARIRTLESPSGTQRAQAVRNIPVLDFQVDRRTNFAVGGTFGVYAQVQIPVPEGRNYARVLGVGAAAITDMTSGGMTTSSGLVQIQSSQSGQFPAAKDAAVSRVINVINGSHAAVLPVTPGGVVTVSMQLSALNPNAFTQNADNFAHIAALVSFTYQEA